MATLRSLAACVPGLGRRSAITFDVGAAGLRACQLRRRGAEVALCDALEFERPQVEGAEQPAAPVVDAAQLSRSVGQGHFTGQDVALVLSSPEIQFLPMRLPEQALAQAPERIEQALKWEVVQESRQPAENLEVRHWKLPAGPGQQPNVMAAVASGALVLQWCEALQQQGLTLRRIEVAPCALARLAACMWRPAEGDLWGVLDLGLRHSTLTVIIGGVPTYIRALSVAAHHWTKKLAEAFEIPYATAEHLKREQSLQPTDRGLRATADKANLLQAADMSDAFSGVLRESLRTLAQEVGRCFSYVMHGFPETSVKRMFLAGGGAGLSGLPALLEAELGIPVSPLQTSGTELGGTSGAQSGRHQPQAAAVLGAAMLDLEAGGRDALAGAARSVNLVPVIQLHMRRRSRRGRAWVGVCTGVGLLLATGWAAERTAAVTLGRLGETVAALEVQRTEAQRRLVVAGGRQARLVEQLQTILGARRPQSWARRLMTLAQEAPAGVFLTTLQVETPAAEREALVSATPEREARANTQRPEVGATAEHGEQTVRLAGYALDHDALLQFLHALQVSPNWQHVELQRAAQESYQGTPLVAFELNCRTRTDPDP
jgi:Tfp pilus assembly PilM family ATPase